MVIHDEPAGGVHRLTAEISIDGILERPVLGGGCCPVPAVIAIQQALEGVPGVGSVEAGNDESQLVLHIDYADSTSPEPVIGEAAEVIRCLGYRLGAVEVMDRADGR